MIKYSGLVTKVKAMEGNLLDASEYETLCNQTGFQSAISYLRTLPSYAKAFEGTLEQELHRDACERRLMSSLYSDYIRLYHFAGLDIRDYLSIFFMHYEIMLIKQSLRNVLNLQSPDIQLRDFDEFFHRHSKLTMDGLNHCDTIPEFMQALDGSDYEELLLPIYASGTTRIADFEEALDHYYFTKSWRVITKDLSKKEQETVAAAFGSDIDLLNIRWIYRSKKYYHMPPVEVARLVIPVRYKLSDKVVNELIEAEGDASICSILAGTVYGSLINESNIDQLSSNSEMLVSDIYKKQARRNPYSLATIACYLHDKEEEIYTIVRILEGIRYGLDPASLNALLPKRQNKKGGSL